MKTYLAFLLIFLGLGIIAGVIYLNSPLSRETRTFSPYTLLTSSWEKYKSRFINSDGRIVDYSQGDITTSEGQSYALLQAVWVDDQKTFDLVWQWTKNTLKRKDDNLFGWRWGRRDDGTYGFLVNGGENSASDADSDIALALILAARRWNQKVYLDQAKAILPDIWKLETDVIGGNRYLVAGNWAKGSDKDIINPSYFAPYAWRIFSLVDRNNDWQSLIQPAYKLLFASSVNNLDKNKAVGLPPDWLAIDKKSGNLEAAGVAGLTTNYSFDAIRVPWRVAVDYLWNNEPLAKEYLLTLRKLATDYTQNKKIFSGYTHDGLPLNENETPSTYGTSIGYFLIAEPQLVGDVYQNKIIKLYSNDTNSFRDDLPYYEENWLWFGTALFQKYIVLY